MVDSQRKHLNYREQFKRLNRAITNGFNLEAVFIAYSIMEDRSESVLRHAGKYEKYMKKRGDRFPTIESKIKEIQKCRSNRKDLLYRYFSDDFLDNILVWKEERNRIVHALLKQELTSDEVVDIALQGKEYARKFCNRSTNYSRALDRLKAKDSKKSNN